MFGSIFSAISTIVEIAIVIFGLIFIYRLISGETRFISGDEMRENLIRKMKRSRRLKKKNESDLEI